MKLTESQFRKLLEKLISEALVKEAGPLGYLSKTNRPLGQQGWDPNAQKQWVQSQPGNGDPAQFRGKGTMSTKPAVEQPQQPEPTKVLNPATAEVVKLLNQANKDQIAQILSILKGQ